MHTTRLPAPSTLRAAGTICGLVAIAMLVGVPAGAAPADPPQLSIAVDNGHSSTAAGDTLDSAITVRNLGTTKIVGLRLTQTMPAGLVFGSADAAGVAGPDGVSWTVDLAPTAETVVRSTMTVSDTPPDLLRLATVACAAASADGPPIVCASDSDQLPAGAAAEAAVAADESATASTALLRWYLAGGAVLVVAAVAVLLLIRRRRRALHLMRTSTVVALLAVVAVGTWSSTAPPVAAGPAGAEPAAAAMDAVLDTAPDSTDVATAAPDTTAPDTTAPDTTAPDTTAPDTTAPDTTAPDTTAPDTTAPVPHPGPGMQVAGFTAALPSDRAAIAVTSAMTQIGHAGPHLTAGTALLPGDLDSYGTPARVHHVGMFIGRGRMVNAPTFGRPVQTAYYRWAGDDFLGSTRPAATGPPTTGLLPYNAPPAVTSSAPSPAPAFLAPPAPPLPETVPLAEPVPPAPTDPGPSAVVATPVELPATPIPDAGVVPAPDVTVTPGPTTTAPTTEPVAPGVPARVGPITTTPPAAVRP